MIYLHELHEIVGGKMDEFCDAVRRVAAARGGRRTRVSSGSGS
jgi:hypothetical protein